MLVAALEYVRVTPKENVFTGKYFYCITFPKVDQNKFALPCQSYDVKERGVVSRHLLYLHVSKHMGI